MHGAILIGPGLPGGVAAPARAAFQGTSFRAHVDLADRLGLPTFIATPNGPVPADSTLDVRRRWPAAKLAAAVIPWAQASDFAPIVALAEDADADAWRRAVGPKMRAPLLGLSPVQRASLVRVLAAGGDLPAWAPGELELLRRRSEPPPTPALAPEQIEDDDETADGRPVRAVVRLPVLERQVQVGRLLYPEATHLPRPRTRADCIDGPRPCPYVGCRHNLHLDVTQFGAIAHLGDPKREAWDASPAHSCVLDLVDANPGGMKLEDIGELLGITRERVRQIERAAHATALGAVTLTREEVRELGDPPGLWTDLVVSG
jgi:hypothetical protein